MILWMGNEEEGIDKGLRTLFIGSPNVSEDRINNILDDYKDIKHLYFGAGCCTPINMNVLDCFINKIKVSAEVDINDLDKYNFNEKVNIMLVVNHKNFGLLNFMNEDNVQIKLQTLHEKENILCVCELNKFIHTNLKNLDGLKYTEDVIIE